MRRVTFQSVLYGVARRAGFEPGATLTTTIAANLGEYIGSRLREAWEAFDWPELNLKPRCFYTAAWASAAYLVGSKVYELSGDNDETVTYYEAILAQASPTGPYPQPSLDSTHWEAVTDLEKGIGYESSFSSTLTAPSTPIGMVWEVYQDDPDLTETPRTVPFRLSDEGVQLRPSAPNSVYLYYQIRCSRVSGLFYNSATAYTAGEVVMATNGECYLCIAASTGSEPSVTSAKWTLQPMPYVLSEFCKIAAYSDWLREDGQTSKANSEETRAQALLENEMDKIVNKQRQSAGFARKHA